MPASPMHRVTPSGPRSIFTPSCSRTSAEPHSDDAARLPCFATFTPHAAATIAASVEMLNVARPSPPVPHVSRRSPSTSIGVASARAVRAKPVISSTVSPFMRRATMKPAIWMGVASPRMIVSNAADASPSVNDSHLTSFAIDSIITVAARRPPHIWGGVRVGDPISRWLRSRRIPRRAPDEVAQDLLAFLGQHRLRVELHAVGRVPDVAQAHHGAVVRPCGHHEIVGDRYPLDDQRVIPRRLERVGDARHDAGVVVADPRSLAVGRHVADDLCAEDLAQALMAEAHAEDRDLPGELFDRLVGDARVVRCPGTGRDDDAVVTGELPDRDLIVAEHRGLDSELSEILDEVVREGVVVVDDREAGRWWSRHHMPSAISMALNIAPAFSNVSSNSRSGRESATTPAPDCTYATPSATTMVRNVIAMSMLPPKPT